jgi:hypothetical protein
MADMSASYAITAISDFKNSGKFGWCENNEYVKGLVFQSKDFSLMACSGGNYVTIAISTNNEKKWETLASHDSTWRAGVEEAFKGKTSMPARIRQVLVDINSDGKVFEVKDT